MSTILMFLAGAIIAACGVLQWYKGIEANWKIDWKKVRQSCISFAFALFFGVMFYYMLDKYLFYLFQIQQNFGFLIYWIMLMLAGIQLFYEFVVQNITKFASAFVQKLTN